MEPGTYIISDPCYILDGENGFSWDGVLDETLYFGLFSSSYNRVNNICNHKDNQHGEFVITNKVGDKFTVACSVTEYGDGVYPDKNGNMHGVDSGMIAAIPIEAVKQDVTDEYVTAEFTKPWVIRFDEGCINFGDKVVINTTDYT